MPPPQGSLPLCVPPGAKSCALLLLSLGLSAYILCPPLYWHFVERVAAARDAGRCPPCICDCATDRAAVLPPGFGNNSADCAKTHPTIHEDLDKNFVELLTEELKLQAVVVEETQQRANSAVLEARKLSSQYQKEAEKCNLGMETCEGAREKAEAALIAQKKVSAMWERRARALGWKTGENTKQDVM